LLAEQIPELDFTNFDIDWGIDLDDDAQEGEIEEDEIPEVPEEPRAKVGDLYELGDHRLICGDSTDVDVIGRLMDGARADLLLTDPPYGIDVVQNKKVGFGEKGKNKITNCNEYAPIIGDETTDTARASYDISLIYSKNQIIFGGNYFTDFLSPSRCWIVWDKQNTGNFADAELAWTSFDKGVRLYHFLWNGLCREGNRKIEGKTRVHPTQKPAGMLSDILKDFSRENDGILDLFGGSGSTLIACEQLNRKCYMCELDPHYVDVIIARWEKLTGRKAVKL
jgi:DNA modification methylase